MTLSNWIGLGIMAVILAAGITIYFAYRRYFKNMDGFNGFVTERGGRPRRADFDWAKAELRRLDQELEDNQLL